MQVHVDTYTGHSGVEMPRRFRLDGREIEVIDNLDQWPGPDYRYFKVRGADGNLYVLRLDESRGEWEMIMFQSAQSEAVPAGKLTRATRQVAMFDVVDRGWLREFHPDDGKLVNRSIDRWKR